jgi:hypothetical protein
MTDRPEYWLPKHERPWRRVEFDTDTACEPIAEAFHRTYERLAPDHNYETREQSAKPWRDVPANNRALMIAVVAALLEEGVISFGPATLEALGRSNPTEGNETVVTGQ